MVRDNLRFWEDRNCLGNMAYAEILFGGRYGDDVIVVTDGSSKTEWRHMINALWDIRRFYGKHRRKTNN